MLKIFLNKKFNEMLVLGLRLLPLHPHMVVNCRTLYIAAVKPLKYLTFMKSRRVIQMVFTSWGFPFLLLLLFLYEPSETCGWSAL